MKLKHIAIICALFPIALLGQENKEKKNDTLTTKPIKLSTVIITGQTNTDPVMTSVKTEIAKKIVQPRNVADLFKDLNGFSLIKRGNYAIDPSFRASQYEQLNIQFDGGTKVMHACPNRMDPITTHVIPEEIEKIEVIKGPYSVRYGATFAGIINLVTQKTYLAEKGLHGSVNSGYESNGNSSVSMLKLQQVSSKFDITGNFGFRDFGNYKDGDETEIPSSFRSIDYGLKVGYDLSDNQRLQAGWRQSFGRDVLHAGLPMDTDEDNSSILSLDYRFTNSDGLLKEINAKSYYSYVDHIMSNTNRPSFRMTEAISTIDAATFGGKIEFKLIPSDKLTIYSGVDAFLVARDGLRTRLVKRNMMGEPLDNPMSFDDKVWQDSYINDYGVFTEGKYAISNKTLLTAGIRYDLIASNIQDPEADFNILYPDLGKRTENNISVTSSVKYIPTSNFMIEFAYGRGVRSANMIERYINHFTVGQDPYEYVGNPFLDAEVNNQFEIGIKGKWDIKHSFINTFKYGISTYYSIYENYIVPVIDPTLERKFMPNAQPQEVKRFVNTDESYKTGFEVLAKIGFLQDFSFKTELSYAYTQNKDLNESLPLTPPLVTRLDLGFEKERFWVNVNYTLTAKQEEIATSFREQETKGYTTLDIRLGVKPIESITIGVAALNVFDVTYNNHLNFSFKNQAGFERVPINDPGRNFSAFVQYRF
ncbi:iron complex outermembrane receptor protein [Aquimarina sp. MAR_2010_214]|uniref:TonB-dependent receptor n=1 Tax=Aquimarina sp. MAR_2010_214 TaxID=1250026 RepID=UPI000C712761|nr:TonB-dependent receptor [Aquimarina sp. MAR_2010_214]PKV50545.1 iron complex outermembrane receptor protein [Aquimarina sp. MAR_2010_214]